MEDAKSRRFSKRSETASSSLARNCIQATAATRLGPAKQRPSSVTVARTSGLGVTRGRAGLRRRGRGGARGSASSCRGRGRAAAVDAQGRGGGRRRPRIRAALHFRVAAFSLSGASVGGALGGSRRGRTEGTHDPCTTIMPSPPPPFVSESSRVDGRPSPPASAESSVSDQVTAAVRREPLRG